LGLIEQIPKNFAEYKCPIYKGFRSLEDYVLPLEILFCLVATVVDKRFILPNFLDPLTKFGIGNRNDV